MIIIPSAGLGTRMSMPYNKSKEMLIDPNNKLPLIQWTLDRAEELGEKALVIIRQQKIDLIKYLEPLRNVDCLILEKDTHDWAETVLKSEHMWEDKNILLLPDTRFHIKNNSLQFMLSKLEFFDEVIGEHRVLDGENWGCLVEQQICEKPKGMTEANAWGVIGFTPKGGKDLFTALQKKNHWYSLKNPSYVTLYDFKDLTRTGKLL